MTKRKSVLDIDLILNYGDEVTLAIGANDVLDDKGDVVKAKYIGGKKFDYRGDVGSSSGLAKKLINLYKNLSVTNLNGNEFWKFKGVKLSDLRKND